MLCVQVRRALMISTTAEQHAMSYGTPRDAIGQDHRLQLAHVGRVVRGVRGDAPVRLRSGQLPPDHLEGAEPRPGVTDADPHLPGTETLWKPARHPSSTFYTHSCSFSHHTRSSSLLASELGRRGRGRLDRLLRGRGGSRHPVSSALLNPVTPGGATSPSTCTAAPTTARPRPVLRWVRRRRRSRARRAAGPRRGSTPRPDSRSGPRCDALSSTARSRAGTNPRWCPVRRPGGGRRRLRPRPIRPWRGYLVLDTGAHGR